MRLKLLVIFALFTGAVVVLNWLVWQGRGKQLSEDRRSLVEFSQASFPLALALLIVHWLFGLTAELVVAVFTAYTGVFAVLDRFVWHKREEPLGSGLQSLVEFSHATFPLALGLLVLQWYFGLTLALVLTVMTVYAGVVVALNKFVWKKRKTAMRSGQEMLVEYSRSFFPVLLVVLIVRSFVFEPFRIPSGSMMPTLLQGDFIFVQKYAYGLRLPVTETKVFETGSPERGDVVVFRLPEDPSTNYIKRVVGLPGDVVVYERHRLTINGEQVALEAHETASDHNPRFVEQLGERTHDILITKPGNLSGDDTYVVPEGHYFVMGDNRDNSRDSRFIEAIPESHLVGEAVRIWMHMDPFPSVPRWERIGQKIQ
jgi:signal peptidase I